MNGKQHQIVATGAGIASAILMYNNVPELALPTIVMASTFGGKIPDWDHDLTKGGRVRKKVTTTINITSDILIYGGVVASVVLILASILGYIDIGNHETNLIRLIPMLILVGMLKKSIMSGSTFKWATAHRGIMHTNLVPIMLILSIGLVDSDIWKYSILGITIGYVSHLWADLYTVDGSPLWYPFSKKHIRIFKFHSRDEKLTIAAKVTSVVFIVLAIIIKLAII